MDAMTPPSVCGIWPLASLLASFAATQDLSRASITAIIPLPLQVKTTQSEVSIPAISLLCSTSVFSPLDCTDGYLVEQFGMSWEDD